MFHDKFLARLEADPVLDKSKQGDKEELNSPKKEKIEDQVELADRFSPRKQDTEVIKKFKATMREQSLNKSFKAGLSPRKNTTPGLSTINAEAEQRLYKLEQSIMSQREPSLEPTE